MKLKHVVEAAIGQNIGVKNCKLLLVGDKSAINMHGAGATQKLGFVGHGNLHRPVVGSQKLGDTLAMRMRIDEYLIDTIPGTPLQPDADQGSALDGHKAFGNAVGQRPQPRAVPCRKQKAFHFAPACAASRTRFFQAHAVSRMWSRSE